MNTTSDWLDPEDAGSTERLAAKLGIAESELRTVLGLTAAQALDHEVRGESSRETQQRLVETASILTQVAPWAGSLNAAWDWYRSFPISSLGGLTAAQLVVQGRADGVRSYLVHISEGGYA